MPQKPIDQWTAADVLALVTERVHEDKRLDFKVDFPRNKQERDTSKTNLDALDTKEFAADVTMFANTAGGLLVYGVGEELDSDGKPTGNAGSAPGVRTTQAPDTEAIRLMQKIRDSTDPSLTGTTVRAIEGFDQGPVFLVQIPRSWSAPHAVKETGRFHGRAGSAKYAMDATTLRRSFLQGHEVIAEVRRFHEARISAIAAGETPVPLAPGPRLIMHLVPFASIEGKATLDVRRISGDVSQVTAGSGADGFALEGYYRYTGPRGGDSPSYILCFGDGRVESVDISLLAPQSKDMRTLQTRWIEGELHDAIGGYVKLLKKHEVPEPAALLITLVGIRGFTLATRSPIQATRMDLRPLSRDVLRLPEVVLQDYTQEIGPVLRPAFDALSRSVGLPGSQNYDDKGKWFRSH